MNTKVNQSTKLSLGPRQLRVLELVGRLSLATASQVNQALYAKGSFTTTSQTLLELYQAGYLERTALRKSLLGNPQWVYKLKNRGHRYLTQQVGLSASELIRPSDNLTSAFAPLLHAVESNDLLVKAHELARSDPTIWLRFKAEPQLRHEEGKRRADRERKPLGLIPDAWLQIIKVKEQGAGEATLWLELERGTVKLEKMKERFASHLQLDGSEIYEQAFGTRGLVAVFVITQGGRKRRDALLSTCEQVLRDSKRPNQASLFRFGVVEEGVEADDLFFNPNRFLTPLSTQPGGLLPLSWRRGK